MVFGTFSSQLEATQQQDNNSNAISFAINTAKRADNRYNSNQAMKLISMINAAANKTEQISLNGKAAEISTGQLHIAEQKNATFLVTLPYNIETDGKLLGQNLHLILNLDIASIANLDAAIIIELLLNTMPQLLEAILIRNSALAEQLYSLLIKSGIIPFQAIDIALLEELIAAESENDIEAIEHELEDLYQQHKQKKSVSMFMDLQQPDNDDTPDNNAGKR